MKSTTRFSILLILTAWCAGALAQSYRQANDISYTAKTHFKHHVIGFLFLEIEESHGGYHLEFRGRVFSPVSKDLYLFKDSVRVGLKIFI